MERTIDSLPSPYTALYIDHSTNGNNMNIENDEEICMWYVSLRIQLVAIDPDEIYSTVCYTKGASFLFYLAVYSLLIIIQRNRIWLVEKRSSVLSFVIMYII